VAAAAKSLGRLLQEDPASGSLRKLDGGGTYGDFLEVIRDVALYGWVPEDGWDDAALDAVRGLYWWVRDQYLAVNVLGGTNKPQPEVGDELLRLADALIVGGVAPDKAARTLVQLAEKLCPSAETATAGPQGTSGVLPVLPGQQHALRQDDAHRVGSKCAPIRRAPEGRLLRRPSHAKT
jgi:hypothetical protein